MLLPPATRLGPYEILSFIGAGGMGEVYRARDTRLDRTVAIKILPSGIAARPETRQRFEREARAVSSLNHPHICALHDIGEQDGIDYLVMEYVEGETLASRLRKGALPLQQALDYAIQIADAVYQAHRQGVVHRDLKPGNVVINRSGAKLLDFGLAKLSNPAAASSGGHTAWLTQTTPLTREGSIIGTFEYMSPEQLEGGEADTRSDIFAFGAVLYEMLTGRRAFEGKSQASLISAIMTGQPPAVSQLQPLASPLLDRVVGKCLAKDPEERWQSARDLEMELKWIAGGGGAAIQVAAPGTVARFRKRERLAWTVAACLMIALAGAGAMNYVRRVPEARVVRFEVTPRDMAAADELGPPSISPDGQYVAFFKGINPWRIWLHSLKTLVTNPLPGTESLQPTGFSWSPDSREIAFSTGSALKKISITGGSPQTICDLTGDDIAWNRDDVILFGGNSNQPLFRVAATGGEPKALTRLDQSRRENRHSFVQFLPDGQHFIYLASSTKPENSATYLGSLDSPEVKRIHAGNANAVYAPPGYLIFLRGASLMAQRLNVRKAELSGNPMAVADSVANIVFGLTTLGFFSVSENGVLTYLPRSGTKRTQLVWFDRRGKRLGNLGEPADYSNPAISPDQKMVAVGKSDPETKTRDIWVIDLQRGTSSRLTFDPADDTNPTWAPDGTRIAFSSNRKGHRDIYMKPASGVGEEQVLTQSEDDKSVEDWSADGQYLIYGNDISSHELLFSFREQKSLPLLHANFVQDQCRFSPNRGGPPGWIAYSSAETGARQVYVRNFAGALSGSGGKWQISNSGGSEPQWRGDGKELFYMQDNKLMAVEVDGAGESFRAGIPKELFEARVTPELRRNRYIVTSDGKRFLMNALGEEPNRRSFTVVLNWPVLLKR